MIYKSYYDSPLGRIILTSEGELLTGLRFEGQKYFPSRNEEWKERRIPVFDETVRWLDVYFGGKDPGFIPPLGLSGTPFRMTVWEILLRIPYGKTETYGSIARMAAERMGLRQMSAQAVGGAVGHNPVSLIVPCHRVIGADGSLTGYAGGIDKKLRLLTLEHAVISGFSG